MKDRYWYSLVILLLAIAVLLTAITLVRDQTDPHSIWGEHLSNRTSSSSNDSDGSGGFNNPMWSQPGFSGGLLP